MDTLIVLIFWQPQDKPDCKSMRNVMQHASSKLRVWCVVPACLSENIEKV